MDTKKSKKNYRSVLLTIPTVMINNGYT